MRLAAASRKELVGMFRLKLYRHGTEERVLELESGREYSFGRGANCDAQLKEEPGISRTHFRVIEENGQWIAIVTAKFGDISHSGQNVKQLALEAGTVFKLGAYDFHFLEPAQQPHQALADSSSGVPATINRHQDQFQIAVGGGSMISSQSNQHSDDESDFDGNDEATRVHAAETEIPYLRIIESGSNAETIKLEGRKWTAGREESCEILLNDRKSSRRQFELSSTKQGYFIRDLGSSNGTLLNGALLAHDELKPVRSGDVIQVGAAVLHFEVRDPNFEKKLMVVPTQIRESLPAVAYSPYEMINYPMASGAGGAVRMDANGGAYDYNQGLVDPAIAAKRKKMRFWIIVAAVLVPLGLYLSFGSDSGPAPKKAAQKTTAAFDKLPPNQQQQVKEYYTLAYKLYTENKLALAADQLQKLHKVLPEGYLNSIAMSRECAAQADIEAHIREMKEQEEIMKQNRLKVESTLKECANIAATSYDEDAIMRCLRPAMDLEPENAMLKSQIAQVKQRIEARNMQKAQQLEYQKLVARGAALFQRAQAMEMNQDYDGAREAYQKHAISTYPDPKGLKMRSQRQMLAIEKKMSSRIDDNLHAAEAAWNVKNYKDVFDLLGKCRNINPSDRRCKEEYDKRRRELNLTLRSKYEDAIIAEGLGGIDRAIPIFKEIVEMDHPDGEYYKRAKNKLRSLGAY
jgi:pSer/pThr/pTyr-binding forkhead associated (FHA) protein